jgi:catechol 2,3-dioxygenase-like lactoylglutathione lyase family enzyme
MVHLGVTMSSTQMSHEPAPVPSPAPVATKIEIIVLPVSDVDRAKRFYAGLGWRLDADFANNDGWRVVQLTPPGSPCSVLFGTGVTSAVAGTMQGTFLVVEDVAAARAELMAHGATVSEVFHFAGGLSVSGTDGRLPGPDPQGQSYRSWASFSDPDGNSWMIQEIKTRLPGRGVSSLDVTTMTELLREAEQHHGQYEPTAPKHHWSGFYAAYVVARAQGKTPEDAVKDGISEIEGVRR